MGAAEANALREKAQEVERRGDVVLQVSQSAWQGYFQRQTFVNALSSTGVVYPTIVVGPDNWVYDAGTLRVLLAKDPAYSGPGLLLVFVEKVSGEQCRVTKATFIPRADAPPDAWPAQHAGSEVLPLTVDGRAHAVPDKPPQCRRGAYDLLKDTLATVWRKTVAGRC